MQPGLVDPMLVLHGRLFVYGGVSLPVWLTAHLPRTFLLVHLQNFEIMTLIHMGELSQLYLILRRMLTTLISLFPVSSRSHTRTQGYVRQGAQKAKEPAMR